MASWDYFLDIVVDQASYAASSLSGTREFIIEVVLQYITEPPNELESEGDDEDACTEGIGLPESSSPASRVPSAQSDAASDVAEASSEIDDTLCNIDHDLFTVQISWLRGPMRKARACSCSASTRRPVAERLL